MSAGAMDAQTVEQQQQQQRQNASRSKLVQRLLNAGSSLPDFMNDLLTTQAVVVAGTEAAGFLIKPGEDGGFSLQPMAHIRPDDSDAQTRTAAMAAFQEIVRPCVEASKDGAIEIGAPDDSGETQFCLVTLLRNEHQIVAASAVITRARDGERAKQRLMSMQLVAGYFDLFTLRKTSEQSKQIAQAHQHTLQLTTSVATSEGFVSTASNLCNELASRTGAIRVSLGWVRGTRVKVKALSHTERFDRKQELVVLIERVMEECLDQEEQVYYGPDGKTSPNVTRDAQALSRAQGHNHVVSIPLRRKDDIVGILTLEFLQEHRITDNTLQALTIATELLAPQLDDRFQNDRWLIVKTGVSLKNLFSAIIGPRYMLTKLIVLLVIGAVTALCLVETMYRVAAPFQFVAQDRRIVSVPFNGQIEDVFVREGEKVTKGQLLLQMKDEEYGIELAKTEQTIAQHQIDAENARAQGKMAEFQSFKKAEAQARADAARIQLRINQAKIRAPMDGVILRGDQMPNRGAEIQQGQELFEIGDPDSLRAEILVEERDIQDIRVGQKGWISTTALPDSTHPVTVERIVPLGQPKDASNVFRVYARLDKEMVAWRPGMAGESRLEVEDRTLMRQWTQRLVEWVQLKLWIWQ